MSYMVMPVYSFECDAPVATHPGDSEEILPQRGEGLRGAIKELRAGGWTVVGTGDARRFYCPGHKPEGSQS